MEVPRPKMVSRAPDHRWGSARAFTLVELLTSMGVLVLLVVMVAQMVDGTVSTTVRSGKMIDADSQARLIFDRMSSDLAGIAKRPDANFYFHHQTGNDTFYFFSDATGYFAGGDPQGGAATVRNSLSLVGYRVSDQISNDTRFELERLGRGLHWYDTAPGTSPNGPLTAMVYLPLTIAGAFSDVLTDPYNNSSNLRSTAPAGDTNAPQWDVLGNQVVRMEFCFLLKDGTLAAVPAMQPSTSTNNLLGNAAPTATNDQSQGYSSGSRWYDTQHEIGYICTNATTNAAIWNSLGLQDIRAVIVAITILDTRSRLIASAQAMTTLTSALPDFSVSALSGVTGKPKLMAEAWNPVVEASTFARTTGLPPAAASSVRIYQRYFYLN